MPQAGLPAYALNVRPRGWLTGVMTRRIGRGNKTATDPQLQHLVGQLLTQMSPQEALAAVMELAGQTGGTLGQQTASNVIELDPPPLRPLWLTLKVSLKGSKPPIWRRVGIRGDLTLDKVHGYLQAAMGWSESHLHRFELAAQGGAWSAPYFLTDFDIEEGDQGTPEDQARLDQVLRSVGESLIYLYDFGDGWEHRLTVEAVRSASGEDPPARCVKAVGGCPPEDVGGIGTWNEIAAALRADSDPQALPEDLEQYRDWLPLGIDPNAPNIEEINFSMSLVGLDPGVLIEGLNSEFDDSNFAPSHVDLVMKAPPDLVVDLARLWSLAEEQPEPSDADLLKLLRPWHLLLDLAGENGISLTAAGWMAPAVCERLWREGGLDWGVGKGNREQYTPELRRLRESALRAGLVRKVKRRLVRTRLGASAALDLRVLADTVAATLPQDVDEAGRDERVLTLLLAASGWAPNGPDEPTVGLDSASRQGFLDEVGRLLTRLGWRVGRGPVLRDQLFVAREVLDTLSRSDGLAGWQAGLPGPAGRYVARRALAAPR